jgi:ribosomal protein S28E/S33
VRYAARVDGNQAEIVEALRAAGASVEVIGLPVDLLVGYMGRTILLEVKNPDTRYGKRGANKNQQEFRTGWRGDVVTLCDGPDSALRAIGAA